MSDKEVHEINVRLERLITLVKADREHEQATIDALWGALDDIRTALAGKEDRPGIITRLALLEQQTRTRQKLEISGLVALVVMILERGFSILIANG